MSSKKENEKIDYSLFCNKVTDILNGYELNNNDSVKLAISELEHTKFKTNNDKTTYNISNNSAKYIVNNYMERIGI